MSLKMLRQLQVAAAALAFSVRALDTEDKPLSELWNTTLQYYSQYSLEDISSTLQKVSKKERSNLTTIFFLAISNTLVLYLIQALTF